MTIPSGGILIGYEQDLTAQRLGEQDPDLEPDRGLTGPAPKTSPGCANDPRAGCGRDPAWAHTRLAARDAPSIAA